MIKDRELNEFLKFINLNYNERITLVVIGGNALVLFNAKPYTKDIDLCLLHENEDFNRLRREFQDKTFTKVDIFYEEVFPAIHLKDILSRCSIVQTEYKNIELYVLNIYDVILMKINRMLGRDYVDCYETCKRLRLKRTDIDKFFKEHLENYHESDQEKRRFIDNYGMFIDSVKQFLT